MATNRGRTERKRRARARKALDGTRSPGEAVEVARVGPTAIASPTQAAVASDQLQSDLTWAPETEGLSADVIAKMIAAGKGESLRRANVRWADIKAVRENWPISRGAKERIAFESMMVLLDPSASTREKQVERRLLLMMDAANRPMPGRLPDQVAEPGTTVEVEVGGTKVTIRGILDAMAADERLGILDMRATKVEPGSKDDYAE